MQAVPIREAPSMTSEFLPFARPRPGTTPPYLYPEYQSTRKRAPKRAPIPVEHTLSEATGPDFADGWAGPDNTDLTRQHHGEPHRGEPIGERIIVTGRVLDEDGAPVPNTLLEIWQANAAGRYLHRRDSWLAPLDPNFLGMGRCLTGADGVYRFLSVHPGAYPWGNHPNAWRPSHIHISLFGHAQRSRLVTQMYFPGDPLHALDPIFMAVPEAARPRLIAAYAHDVTEEQWALGYRFDITLRGPGATPFEPPREGES
jgi:protocatechuate 3,4-dioxygenase, beta subunit